MPKREEAKPKTIKIDVTQSEPAKAQVARS